MKFGVVTHMNQGQGWTLAVIDEAKALKASHIRDGLTWARMMPSPGVMDFSDIRDSYPDDVKAAGVPLISVMGYPRAYHDGSVTAFTPVGKHEFGDYVKAVLQRFPGSVTRIEIGNEFNAGNFVEGYVKTLGPKDRARAYVEILAYLYPKVRPLFGQVQILGAATHSIPIGYIKEQVRCGMLRWCDGVAIHPYTSEPEHVGEHLSMLRDLIADKPIYATECGAEFENPNDAPAYLMKIVAALAGGGVVEASWYALRDEPFWPNMGLMSSDGSEMKPAGVAFLNARNRMYQANVVDVSPADRLARMFQFDERTFVAWGTGQEITFQGSARNALGEPVGVTHLSDDPVWIIVNAGTPAPVITPTDLIGDTFWQFSVLGVGPWSWQELRGTGALQPLVTMGGGEVNGEPWIPYIGHPSLRPLQVRPLVMRPADFAVGNPAMRCSIVERFACSGSVRIEAEWTSPLESDVTIKADGVVIWDGVTPAKVTLDADVTEALEFIAGPGTHSGSLVTRRIRVFQA